MRKPVTLPCSAEVASMIIGNGGYESYGTYIKLLQIIHKLPDHCLPKDRVTHIVTVNGMEPFTVDRLLENPALFISDETRIFPVEEKVIHKKSVDKVIEVKETIIPQHPLQLYVINGNGPIQFPRIKSLQRQLSVEECQTLLVKYPKLLIADTLEEMEDWAELTIGRRAKSHVFKTLNIWCRNALKWGWTLEKREQAKVVKAMV